MRAGEDVVAIVAGDPLVTNGIDVRFFGRDYRAHALAKDVPADPDRLWFLGAAAPPVVAELLGVTDLHVYPSRPYAVSRTLVGAMAAGCVILAWDTPAIREFLTPERTGLLTAADMDAALGLARAVLRDPAGHRPLGEAAAERPILLGSGCDPAGSGRALRPHPGGGLKRHARPVHPPGLPSPVWPAGRRTARPLWLALQLPGPGPQRLPDTDSRNAGQASDTPFHAAGREPGLQADPLAQTHGRFLELSAAVYQAIRGLPELRRTWSCAMTAWGRPFFCPTCFAVRW